jgi:hypothetical protein
MSSQSSFLSSVHAALDARRRAEGLSWVALARAINGPQPVLHPLSPATISSLAAKRAAEGDGVLGMLRWLGRSPESFLPGHPRAGDPAALLPHIPAGKILRFDTRKLHAALDAQRQARSLTWAAVAAATRSTPAMLRHLARGAGRTSFPHVFRFTAWLGQPIANFIRIADH